MARNWGIGLLLLCSCANAEREWLENMAWHHRYTPEEVAAATGLAPEEAKKRIEALGKGPAETTPFTILPYPGGRHPRIGFLDGAKDPHRDTKFSLFLPGGGYIVVDFPEAIWANKELVYLAHTHIKTAWEKKGITLERIDWTRKGGGLYSRRVLPNGLAFEATVTPAERGADLELKLINGTTEKLTGLRAQVCVLLKGAPGFDAQTRDNKIKVESLGMTAVRDGKRWIATVFDTPRLWENPPCPCIHADPNFPDLAPGEDAVVRGKVFYSEGDSISR